jgi:hypothetical protein
MKKLVTVVLVAELLIAYFVLAPTCIRRHDQVRAFGDWHGNPTPETRAELDRQKRITELYGLGFSAVVFGVMAGATLFAARAMRQRHSAHPDLSDETPMA